METARGLGSRRRGRGRRLAGRDGRSENDKLCERMVGDKPLLRAGGAGADRNELRQAEFRGRGLGRHALVAMPLEALRHAVGAFVPGFRRERGPIDRRIGMGGMPGFHRGQGRAIKSHAREDRRDERPRGDPQPEGAPSEAANASAWERGGDQGGGILWRRGENGRDGPYVKLCTGSFRAANAYLTTAPSAGRARFIQTP